MDTPGPPDSASDAEPGEVDCAVGIETGQAAPAWRCAMCRGRCSSAQPPSRAGADGVSASAGSASARSTERTPASGADRRVEQNLDPRVARRDEFLERRLGVLEADHVVDQGGARHPLDASSAIALSKSARR